MSDPVEIDDQADRWRLVCPHGHTNWRPTRGGWRCRTCADHGKVASFEELRDRKTGERVSRQEVHL